MRNPIFYLFLSIVCLFTACKHPQDTPAPSCIDDKIEELKKLPVFNPPAEVWEGKIDQKTYYLISSDCCDQLNYLYNENCQIVCAPSGGLSGNGDGGCPNFIDSIQWTLIWRDPRK